MKKQLLFEIMLLVSVTIAAQEITVKYQGSFNTQSPKAFSEAGLNEEMRKALANAYKDVVFTSQLSYKNGESDFRALPSEKKQTITFMGHTIDVNEAMKPQLQNYTYKNHPEKMVLNKVSIFGKEYIVSEDVDAAPYIIQDNESKEILGYECKKAVSPDGKVTVWFTEHIPLKDEPRVTGLNGLALEIIDDTNIFVATEIILDQVNVIPVEPKGKTTTKKDFDAMIKKRTEMMKRN